MDNLNKPTPFTIDFDRVDYMKLRPGAKLVLGPEITIVVASCKKNIESMSTYEALIEWMKA